MKKYLISAVSLCSIIILSACSNEKSKNLPDGKLNPCTIRFSWWGGDDRHKATLDAL